MYGYRSSIAHDRKPDFKTPQLSVLQNANSANELIKEAVKKSLRQAYTEPQLIADLHNV
jgi:mannitol/fructose-specific phosphotransferase system IIA component (Ntr-type)